MSRGARTFVMSQGKAPIVVLVHGGWSDHCTWPLSCPTSPIGSSAATGVATRAAPWAEPVPRRQDDDDLVPHAERLTLTGAGHFPDSPNPAEYATAVRQFVSSATSSLTMEALS
jgi:hypothetical protein